MFSPICPHLGCGFRWDGVFLLIVFALLGISLKNLYAIPREDPSVARGRMLYAQHHCAACHKIHGEVGKVGPDLSYVADQRPDRPWHLRHFRDPQSVSPGSIMPAFPLEEKDLHDRTSYMLMLEKRNSHGIGNLLSAQQDLRRRG